MKAWREEGTYCAHQPYGPMCWGCRLDAASDGFFDSLAPAVGRTAAASAGTDDPQPSGEPPALAARALTPGTSEIPPRSGAGGSRSS